jgi:hypothetical protein
VTSHLECGGHLPSITELDDPLQSFVAVAAIPRSRTPAHDRDLHQGTESPSAELCSAPAVPRRAVLSSTSLLNPFFGYPAVDDSASPPSLRHGRRRKRDLLMTLVRLWCARWGYPIQMILIVFLLVLALRRARWRVSLPMRLRSPAAPSPRLFTLFSS